VKRVAVTGVAGNPGTALLERLDRDAAVEKIVGIDRAQPRIRSSKLRLHELDIRDDKLPEVLRDEKVERIFHLAWVVDPTHSASEEHDINIKGTENVLSATVACGARQLIHLSDMTAYGAYEDNPEILTEDMPLRGNPDFPYAADKAFVEGVIGSFAKAHPNILVTVLRPCMILGPGMENFVTRLMDMPMTLAVREGNSDVQFIHVDDMVEAMLLAAKNAKPGAFNIVPEDAVPFDDMLELVGRPSMRVPAVLGYTINAVLWGLRVPFVPAPPTVFSFMRHPWRGCGKKAARELGFTPRHTARDTLETFIEDHRREHR